MVGITSLMREVAEREKLETKIGEYGSKWKDKRHGGILAYGIPLSLDEWENPTEEGFNEMLNVPNYVCAQNLTGYRLVFKRMDRKPKRDTMNPVCWIDGHVDFGMVLHALNSSVDSLDKYPKWIPDATFVRDEWFGIKGEFRGVPMEDFNDPLMHHFRMRIGFSDGQRIIPRNLFYDWHVRHDYDREYQPIHHVKFPAKDEQPKTRRRLPLRRCELRRSVASC